MRTNTQGVAASFEDASKQLHGTILPIVDRLYTEIKHRTKEINKGGLKGAKAVDKARAATQKHIELLGTQVALAGAASNTATGSSRSSNTNAAEDPYVLRRGINYRLNQQINEENSNRQEMIAIQRGFAQFEEHFVRNIQEAMGVLLQISTSQSSRSQHLYKDMATTWQRIPPDFEWTGFVDTASGSGVLINPSAPARSLSGVSFANQDQQACKPLIAGPLERRSKVLRSYESGYYAVTPAGFLHQFRWEDDLQQDPVPATSLYLSDCTLGALVEDGFAVKGKDVTHGRVGSVLSKAHEYRFRAHSPAAAKQWWDAIASRAGHVAAVAAAATAQSDDLSEDSGPDAAVKSDMVRQHHQPPVADPAQLEKHQGLHPQQDVKQ